MYDQNQQYLQMQSEYQQQLWEQRRNPAVNNQIVQQTLPSQQQELVQYPRHLQVLQLPSNQPLQEPKQGQQFNMNDEEEEIDEIIETDPEEDQHHPIVDGDTGRVRKVSDASEPKDYDENQNFEQAAYDSRFFSRHKDTQDNQYGFGANSRKRASSAKKLPEQEAEQADARYQNGEASSFVTAGSLNMMARRPTSSAKKRPSDTVVKTRLRSGEGSQSAQNSGGNAKRLLSASQRQVYDVEGSGNINEECKVIEDHKTQQQQPTYQPAVVLENNNQPGITAGYRPWNEYPSADEQMYHDQQQDFLMLEHQPQQQYLSQSGELSPSSVLVPNAKWMQTQGSQGSFISQQQNASAYLPNQAIAFPQKRRWVPANSLLALEPTAPKIQESVSVVDVYRDQQTKFDMLPHFLPVFLKQQSDGADTEHSATEFPQEEYGIIRDQEIEEVIVSFSPAREHRSARDPVDEKAYPKTKAVSKNTPAKLESIRMKKQRRLMRRRKLEYQITASVNYDNQILVQQLPGVVQVLNLDQTQVSQMSSTQQSMASPQQQIQERRELRQLQEQQFRLSMSSMKNQISEVIKEDLNESLRSHTGRNSPTGMRSDNAPHSQRESYRESAKKLVSGECAMEQTSNADLSQCRPKSTRQQNKQIDIPIVNQESQQFEQASQAIAEEMDYAAEQFEDEEIIKQKVPVRKNNGQQSDYESSPKESKIDQVADDQELCANKEERPQQPQRLATEEDAAPLDQGPTVTPVDSLDPNDKKVEESVRSMAEAKECDEQEETQQQNEVKPADEVAAQEAKVDPEATAGLESLKQQIEGISDMLQGLNNLVEGQHTTPKSTKRDIARQERAARGTSNKKEEQTEETGTVMPQRRIKAIKIKKVQVQRMKGQKVHVTTTLGGASKEDIRGVEQQARRSLRKSQSATMRVNRRKIKQSSSADSARCTGAADRRPWVAGVAPPSNGYERHKQNHQDQQRMFRSSRLSAQTHSDFAHLADRQWRSLSTSPVRLSDYPASAIQPYEARLQPDQANWHEQRGQQAYNYQSKRLMLRSAQQSAPTGLENNTIYRYDTEHPQMMQPPVPSTMASMKRMRFKKMHTTINPQSSSQPTLMPKMLDNPRATNSNRVILDPGRRRFSMRNVHQGGEPILRNSQAASTSNYSFAPASGFAPMDGGRIRQTSLGMSKPTSAHDRPARLLSAQTKLAAGGTGPSLMHHRDRNNFFQPRQHSPSLGPDDQIPNSQFYQPNVEVIYEKKKRNRLQQRKKQVQSAKLTRKQPPQQYQPMMMHEMPARQRPMHYPPQPNQQSAQMQQVQQSQAIDRRTNLPQSLQASPYNQVLKLPPYPAGVRRGGAPPQQQAPSQQMLIPDFHPAMSMSSAGDQQQRGYGLGPQAQYYPNQQPVMARPPGYQPLNASMQVLTSQPLQMAGQQQRQLGQLNPQQSNTMRRPPAVPQQQRVGPGQMQMQYPTPLGPPQGNHMVQQSQHPALSHSKTSETKIGVTDSQPFGQPQGQRLRSASRQEVGAARRPSAGGPARVRSGTTRAPPTSLMNTQPLAAETLLAPGSQRKALSRRNSAQSGRGKNSGSSSLGNGKLSSARKRPSNASARPAPQLVANGAHQNGNGKKKNDKQLVIQQIYNFG